MLRMSETKALAHRVKISLENGYDVVLAFQAATGVQPLAPCETDYPVVIRYFDPKTGHDVQASGFKDMLDFLYGAAIPLGDVPLTLDDGEETTGG